MRLRFAVPQPVLAELPGVVPAAIAKAERQIKPLLQRSGHATGPARARLTTLADLTALAEGDEAAG